MLQSFIKIAWRNLARNKIYSFINIFGLALGLASAILILLYVENEMSYDQFHQKKDELYMVWNRDLVDGAIKCWPTTSAPLGPALKATYPDIKNYTRMTWPLNHLASYKDKSINVFGNAIDPSFLDMFTFPFVEGNPSAALSDVDNIVITESLARELFGSEDAMNKIIVFENKFPLTVKGILKDPPRNSHFLFEYLLPWNFQKKAHWDDDFNEWGNNFIQTFVELQPGASQVAVNNKIKSTVKDNDKNSTTEVFLHSITKLYLYSRFENGVSTGGRIDFIRMIGFIAAFILLIACINFMNLGTARSQKRAREVGIRKVIGASRKELIVQFLGESIFISFLAFLLALFIVQLVLPAFNNMLGTDLDIQFNNANFWLAAFSIILLTGLLAGSYPAFYLSSFLPVKVLKSNSSYSKTSVTPRQALVVIQFVFSIGLIISTILIEQQLRYVKDRPSGYNSENLVYHQASGALRKNYNILKNELISSGTASNVCITHRTITEDGTNTWGITWAGKDPNKNICFDLIYGKDGFTAPLGIQLMQGRDMDVDQFPTDTSACLLNESAFKTIGCKEPIGRTVEQDSIKYRVVGVFRDFIWGSPYFATRPMIVFGDNFSYSDSTSNLPAFINVRLNTKNPVKESLAKMEQIFKKYNPGYPFDYHFVDEVYAAKFKSEQLLGKLAVIFALLSIVISCLGLFGLAAFTAEQRTKEIGIRRVMGASIGNIVMLLSKDFLKLVILAALITFPVTWWAMYSWLQDYTYRISIGFGVFVAAGLLAILISLVTVSFQAVKAAKANPVKSLRSE